MRKFLQFQCPVYDLRRLWDDITTPNLVSKRFFIYYVVCDRRKSKKKYVVCLCVCIMCDDNNNIYKKNLLRLVSISGLNTHSYSPSRL
jgi:hypothetical protein